MRTVHVAEPRWDDEPYFEEAQAGDYKTALWIGIGCLIVAPVLFLSVLWWLLSTIVPGRNQHRSTGSQEISL